MKIFITGATGFIGRHLVNAISSGNDVMCYVRRNSNIKWLNGENVRYTCSLDDVGNYDVVYHLAGVLGKKGIPLSVYRDAHIHLAYNILQRMNKRQKFIYLSTSYVDYPVKDYETTKIDGEQVTRDSGIDYCIVRPSIVYGQGDLHHLPLYQWICRLRSMFPILGDGNNLVAPLFVQDLKDLLIKAIYYNDVVYLAGEIITMNDYVKAIAKGLGVKEPHIHIPDWKIYHNILHGDFLTQSRPFKTDYETTPLEVGLKYTIAWYRDNGYIDI